MPRKVLSVDNSATRWLVYPFNIRPFATPNFCPKPYKRAKVSSKFCQIVNETFQTNQTFKTSCQSGEISSNLVTLDSTTTRGWNFIAKTHPVVARLAKEAFTHAITYPKTLRFSRKLTGLLDDYCLQDYIREMEYIECSSYTTFYPFQNKHKIHQHIQSFKMVCAYYKIEP